MGRLVELETDDPSQLDSLCEKLLANPLIEDFEVELEDGRRLSSACIQFPGSCDERDAVAACERVGEARLVWHEETDLAGLDAIVVPGGFSYGDYLRAGAIARFSPAMEAVARFAADGGPVLGICNGFQVLCEAGLLPGALLPNERLRFIFRQVDLVAERDRRTRSVRSSRPARRLSVPVKHMSGRYFAPTTCSTRSRPRARWPSATRMGRTRTGRCATSPASPTRRATSWA